MDKEWISGWQKGVNWIYDLSLQNSSNIGVNPKGGMVTNKMKELGGIQNSGFAEGLIFAIGKPIELLKEKIKK
jgi:hypothetical protein